MLTINDLRLQPEHGGLATVICNRCQETIGRVLTEADESVPDVAGWEAKVNGELELLASEHEPHCPHGG